MNYCKFCGVLLTPGIPKCPNCGHEVLDQINMAGNSVVSTSISIGNVDALNRKRDNEYETLDAINNTNVFDVVDNGNDSKIAEQSNIFNNPVVLAEQKKKKRNTLIIAIVVILFFVVGFSSIVVIKSLNKEDKVISFDKIDDTLNKIQVDEFTAFSGYDFPNDGLDITETSGRTKILTNNLVYSNKNITVDSQSVINSNVKFVDSVNLNDELDMLFKNTNNFIADISITVSFRNNLGEVINRVANVNNVGRNNEFVIKIEDKEMYNYYTYDYSINVVPSEDNYLDFSGKVYAVSKINNYNTVALFKNETDYSLSGTICIVYYYESKMVASDCIENKSMSYDTLISNNFDTKIFLEEKNVKYDKYKIIFNNLYYKG